MLLYDVTSDRSFCAVRHWVNSIDVSINFAQKIMTSHPDINYIIVFFFNTSDTVVKIYVYLYNNEEQHIWF